MRPRPRPEPKGEAHKKTWKDYAEEHFGLLLAGGFTMFTLIHILFVSSYDPTTALAILSVSDRPGILISTAAQLISLAALWAFVDTRMLTWMNKEYRRARTFWEHVPPSAVFALVLPLALPQFSVLWIIAIVFTRLALRRRRKKAAARGALTATGHIVVSSRQYEWSNFISVILFFYLFTTNLSVPWTTKEGLSIDGSPVTVGYVMGESSGQLLVLDSKRQAIWIPVDDINSRQVCVDPHSPLIIDTTLGQFIARLKYEQCPDELSTPANAVGNPPASTIGPTTPTQSSPVVVTTSSGASSPQPPP